ncbi:hypothetical protein M514_02756, partial [Trichuris suis]
MTYGDMYKAIREANFEMHSAGVNKGDVVVILLPDSSHLLVYAVAVWQLGGIVTIISPCLSADEIEKRIRLVNAKWIISGNNWKCTFRTEDEGEKQTVLTNVSTKAYFTLQTRNVEIEQPSKPGTSTSDLLVAKVDLALIMIDQRPRTFELVAIPFTHYNVSSAIQMLGDTLVFQKRPPGELFLVCFPLWTASGLLLALHALCSHYHVVVRDCFEMHSLSNLLRKYKINILTAPVEMLAFLDENEVRENKLNSATMVCAASNHQMAQKATSVLRKLDSTVIVFSMSECLSWPFVSLEIPTNEADRTPVLVAPNFECKITDPYMVECYAEITGDIYVRGPACASTYFSGEPLSDQYGWIRTGIHGEYSEKDMCVYFSPDNDPEKG